MSWLPPRARLYSIWWSFFAVTQAMIAFDSSGFARVVVGTVAVVAAVLAVHFRVNPETVDRADEVVRKDYYTVGALTLLVLVSVAAYYAV